jgi:2-polyprenyl-6-hydroxyphenyl methylase/3-demethylubiquinone-9 3-methyltransferase
MKGYYEEKLSAGRLKKCYEIAPPRVRQYFISELAHVLKKIKPGDRVLDLGCGFGRIMPEMAQKAGQVVGIDNSYSSLSAAKKTNAGSSNCLLAAMNALHLGFFENAFDVVVCIQNGISAFHVDKRELIRESLRVIRPGGIALFSSYSDKFWDHRLEWFRMQAEAGLLGQIDEEKTGDGDIVCKDGFTATTVRPSQFLALANGLGAEIHITEVDASSVFFELEPGN